MLCPIAMPVHALQQAPAAVVPQESIVPDAPRDSGQGQLLVIVRDVRNPAKALSRIQVSMKGLSEGRGIWEGRERFVTDSAGQVVLSPAPGGDYEIHLRQVGHKPLRLRLTVPSHCASALEAYMVVETCDLGNCPAPAPRAILTTCRKRAA